MVILINHGKEDFLVENGMKIAQMVLKPIYNVEITQVKEIGSNTTRGEKGFGSSGV